MEFIYQPLQPANTEIRLLTLHAAQSIEVPILCGIHHVSLSSKPKFEALSYTWGDEENQGVIFLLGKPFNARENLIAALRRLRFRSAPRLLWIDAICIDQKNLTEKEFQLPLMTQIYACADQVCVWLGESSEASDIGMASLTSGFVQYSMSWNMWRTERKHGNILLPLKERFKSWEATQNAAELASEMELGEIRDLLTRPWWTRVWIMQEAIVARRLVLMCGSRTAPWESVESAVKRSMREKGAVKAFDIVINPEFDMLEGGHRLLTNLRKRYMEQKWAVSVYELLYEFRQLHCSNARDRIYGFLGLVESSLGFRVFPDYRSPVHSVYLSFARDVIKQTGSLDILNCKREWKAVPESKSPVHVYSLIGQAKYHHVGCTVQDGPGKKPRQSWVRLPPGWERVEQGKTCYYYDWNVRVPYDRSPFEGLGPQKPQATGKQRVLPEHWKKDWDNLGRTKIGYMPTGTQDQTLDPLLSELSRLPSWVPNWATRTQWDPIPFLDWSNNEPRYNAGGKVAGLLRTPGIFPSTLSLEGIHFDTISSIAQPWHPTSNIPPMSRKGIEILRSWEDLGVAETPICPYGGHIGRKNALWRTHIADGTGEFAAPPEYWNLVDCWYDRVGWAKVLPDVDELAGKSIIQVAKMQTEVSYMDTKMEEVYLSNLEDVSAQELLKGLRDTFSISKKYGDCVRRIHRVCAHRAFFITKNGYMGLAPWNARAGDSIFVLKGGKTPFVLRKVPVVTGYTLVGEAFVYGVMGGEALRSELPLEEVWIM